MAKIASVRFVRVFFGEKPQKPEMDLFLKPRSLNLSQLLILCRQFVFHLEAEQLDCRVKSSSLTIVSEEFTRLNPISITRVNFSQV